MIYILWILLSAAIFLTFDLLSNQLGRQGWRRFMSTFILAYAQILLTQLLLGLLFVLSGPAVFFINLVITGLLLGFFIRMYGKDVLGLYLRDSKRSIGRWFVDIQRDYLFSILLSVALLLAGWLILLGTILPVTDVDGNAYHMTFIAQAIQNSHIYDVPTSITWLTGYPKGGELIQMWNVIIVGRDTFADLAQLPFLLLGVVAVYAIALRVGVAKQNARFVSLGLVFLPIVINQAKTTYVDIILSALFLAALAIATQKKLPRIDLILLGILFALLISIKATGALFVIACLPFLFYTIFSQRAKGGVRDYRTYASSFALVVVPASIGLYWYIKNLVLYGTPLYPFGLKVGDIQLFSGRTFQDFIAGAFTNSSVLPHDTVGKLWFVWTEQKDWFGCLYNYDSTFSGLGPLWFVLLIPSILVASAIAIWRRNYMYLAIGAVFLLVFMMYPANFYSRYVIFLVAFGLISLGYVLTELSGLARNITKLIMLWLCLIVVATTFTLCNFTPKVLRDQYNSIKTGNDRSSIAYGNAVGQSMVFMQDRLKVDDIVIYDSKPYYVYPLWREDYANKVFYIDSSSADDWRQKVRDVEATYIFTNKHSREHRWARLSTNMHSVYSDELYEVYEVR